MIIFRSKILWSLIAILFLLGANFAQAQNRTGSIRGTVTDPSGAAVPSASVQVTGPTGQTTTVVSGANGDYEVRNLAPGKYTLKIVATGFELFQAADIDLAQGQLKSVDAPLIIQVEEQKVSVSAAGGGDTLEVSPENNAGAIVMQGNQLDSLSDDPDQLQADLNALAGPSIGPNGGQMYIDGFTGGQLPPKSSIREVRINQNPFSSEYDRLGFGRIEILTRPGTDSLHGSGFIMGNTKALNTSDPFAKLPNGQTFPGYYTLQYNGNIGGSIGKKASYFFSVQRRNINEVSLGAALDPTTFNATQSGVTIDNPRTRTEISPRFDYQLTKNNTLTIRYEHEQNDQKNAGIGQYSLLSQAYNSNTGGESLQVSDSQVFGGTTVNESRFQYNQDRTHNTPLSFLPSVQVSGFVTTGGSTQGTTDSTSNSYEFQDYISMVRGKHILKFGTRVRDTKQASSQLSNANGTFSFSTPAQFQAAEQAVANNQPVPVADYPYQFTITTGTALTNINDFDAGLFLQDDFRWKPNITLSGGLRFETQTNTPSSANIPDHADVAPRLAVAWGIGKTRTGTPKVVVRAGWGIFYDRFSQNNILTLARQNGVNQISYLVKNPNFFPNVPNPSTLTPSNSVLSVSQIAPNFRSPYTMQAALTLERQLTRTTTITVNYTNARGVRQLLSTNINSPRTPGDNTTRPLYPNTENIFQYQSHGIFRQNQLSVNMNIRVSSRVTLNGFYTLNYASGTAQNPVSFYNIAADYGRTAFSVRHRVFLGGNINTKYGFSFSPFMTASSGTPFNITTGSDLNGDGVSNDRPTFGVASDPGVVSTIYGYLNPAAPVSEPVIPVNLGTGPSQFSLNLRVAKSFGFGRRGEAAGNGGNRGGGGGGGFGGGEGRPGGGPPGGGFGGPGGGFGGGGAASGHRYTLTLSVNARNLFNVVSAGQPVGSMSSPQFLQSNSLSNGGGFGGPGGGGPGGGGGAGAATYNRQISLQANFSF